MKKSSILAFLCIGLSSYAQVGIGTSTPRGALDINQPTTNDAGLVLPTNNNVINIKNPQDNGNPVPGTIMYDSTLDCVRLYKEGNTWSGCIGERNSSGVSRAGNGVIMGITGILNGTTWLNDITNYSRFGTNGTYNKSIGWVSVRSQSNSDERRGLVLQNMESGEEMYSKLKIIQLGTSFIEGASNNIIAQSLVTKLKDYVNLGGILFLDLQMNGQADREIIQELFKEYTGQNLTYLTGTSVRTIPGNNMITDHPVNNGPFGDQRNQPYNATTVTNVYGNVRYNTIPLSSLPTNSEVYLVNLTNNEPLVFAAGPENRVIFHAGEQTIFNYGGSSTAASERAKFIFNQTVNLINKAIN